MNATTATALQTLTGPTAWAIRAAVLQVFAQVMDINDPRKADAIATGTVIN